MRCRAKLICFVLLIWSCKKPFTPPATLSVSGRYLVVEGVISMNDSTVIRLSRTKKVDTFRTIIAERGAQVSIESNANTSYPLPEISAGVYAAAPLNLDATKQYRLSIKTSDGKTYASDFV